MLANRAAIPWIRQLEIIKDEMIPTHAVVRITLGRNAAKEKRRYAKSLPSLRKLFDDKVGQLLKDLRGKGKHEAEGKEKKTLHRLMDENLANVARELRIQKTAKDTTGF